MATFVLTPLARRLEAVMFGRYEREYRLFEQAVLVVAVGLALAWGLAAFGVLPLGAGTESMLATAASIAISAFVVVGLLQFLVLANVLERTNEDVATKAAELEEAAEQLETTAEELETTADEVENAAETVDEAAEDVEQTADEVEQTADEVEQTAGEVEETVDEVEQTAEEVEQTADEVEQTATETGDDDAAEKVTEVRTRRPRSRTRQRKSKTRRLKSTTKRRTRQQDHCRHERSRSRTRLATRIRPRILTDEVEAERRRHTSRGDRGGGRGDRPG